MICIQRKNLFDRYFYLYVKKDIINHKYLMFEHLQLLGNINVDHHLAWIKSNIFDVQCVTVLLQ